MVLPIGTVAVLASHRRGVAECVTSGAIDPLQSDSYPQSSGALHLIAHTHIQAFNNVV